MTKIAVNSCYGGFSITKEGGKLLKKRGVNVQIHDSKYSNDCYCDNEDFGITSDDYNAWRADPRLIEFLETEGIKNVQGSHSAIRIVEIPDDVDWEITDYDGIETVREKHRSW